MRTSWSLMTAFLGLPMLLGLPLPVYGQRTLADIIAAIRQNEKLYKNIDVVMQSTYDIGNRKPMFKSEVIRQKTRTRFVSQGEWFRLERRGGSEDSQQKASMDRIRAFDGQTTRVLEQKAVGNISRERLEDENFIRPHLLLNRHSGIPAVPFSVYLSGHKAIQAHPNGHWNQGLTMQITYEGEEKLNDLKCHKVLVKVLLKSGQPHDGRMLWLAGDRNYLPVRELSYTYRFSKDLPVGQGSLDDLQEIKPGVWFPFKAEVTSYNKYEIQQTGRRELQWKERYVVERVNLAPKHDREFFSQVDFPVGTAVYEVEKGKIIRSWRQGAP